VLFQANLAWSIARIEIQLESRLLLSILYLNDPKGVIQKERGLQHCGRAGALGFEPASRTRPRAEQ
jgi:hypothetical protein